MNWVALIIFIAAALFYLVLFNPATLVYHTPFIYCTASLGAGIPCAVVYFIVMKLFVVKSGKVGYVTLNE